MRLNRFVFILPTSDYLDYGSCVMKEVVLHSLDVGDKYVILEGEEAAPQNIKSAIMDLDPALVVGIGHGSPCAYTVQNRAFFLMCLDPANKCEDSINMELVRGRVWFLNSCEVGKELGRRMVEEYGAVAFMGSKEPFLFPVFDPPCFNEDVTAVFEAEYTALRYLLRGFTVGEAHRARLKAYEDLIREYTVGVRNVSPNAPLVVRLLHINKDIAVVYGNDKVIVATAEPMLKSATMSHPLEAGFGLISIVMGGLVLLSEALSKLKRKAK